MRNKKIFDWWSSTGSGEVDAILWDGGDSMLWDGVSSDITAWDVLSFWILLTGLWNDAGTWLDASLWID